MTSETHETERTELIQTIEDFLKPALHALEPEPATGVRGRPRILPAVALWAGILVCVVRGFSSQLELWRLLNAKGLWDFPRFGVSDDAIYTRLQHLDRDTFKRLFAQVTQLVRQRLPPQPNYLGQLASFATGVYALDGTTLDKVCKHLPSLRKRSEEVILPGKLAAVFDLRAQVWRTVEFVADAQQNDKVAARTLLTGLEAGSLLLADLGYFAFEWFDDLTRQGFFWVSRLRAKTSFEVIHRLYAAPGVSDAIVWLGKYRADRAAYAVRLVQLTQHGKTWMYLTNVLDPRLLPLSDIARLYARRWDIERMFDLVKTHLHLHLLWSGHVTVILHQVWAVFTVAQIILGMRADIAARAQADLEEVSLDLLIRWLPRFAEDGQDPVQLIVERGRQVKIIRPVHRVQLSLPDPAITDYLSLPENAPLTRVPRYANKD